MRFAHHLSSHLTPEWRSHYIDYEDLKERLYKMVGAAPPKTQEEEDECKPFYPLESIAVTILMVFKQ